MIHISTAILAIEPNAIFTTEDNYLSSWDCDLKKPTEEEIDKKITELRAAEPMRLLRIERNRRLAETDWRFRSDLTPSQAWIDYCKALRDLPKMITPDDSTEPLPAPTINEQGQLVFLHWPEVPE